MSDHRDITGAEWANAPGPLRAGDYWRAGEMVLRLTRDARMRGTSYEQARRVIPVIKPLDVPEEVDAELSPEIGTIEGDAHTTEFAAAHDKGFCLYADSLGRYRLAWPDNSDQPLDGWVRFVATGKRGKATE